MTQRFYAVNDTIPDEQTALEKADMQRDFDKGDMPTPREIWERSAASWRKSAADWRRRLQLAESNLDKAYCTQQAQQAEAWAGEDEKRAEKWRNKP